MLARWRTQPIKYRVQERQPITERLQSISLKTRLSFVAAEIANFDYRHQDEYVRGIVDEWNPDVYGEFSPKVINGEIAVPHRNDFQSPPSGLARAIMYRPGRSVHGNLT